MARTLTTMTVWESSFSAQLFHPFMWILLHCLLVSTCLPVFLFSSGVKPEEQVYWGTEVKLLWKVA